MFVVWLASFVCSRLRRLPCLLPLSFAPFAPCLPCLFVACPLVCPLPPCLLAPVLWLPCRLFVLLVGSGWFSFPLPPLSLGAWLRAVAWRCGSGVVVTAWSWQRGRGGAGVWRLAGRGRRLWNPREPEKKFGGCRPEGEERLGSSVAGLGIRHREDKKKSGLRA